MVTTRCKTSFNAGGVKRAARDGSVKSLGHAAAYIRRAARNSIKSSAFPSAPGMPPHTRKNKRLKNAIKYAVEASGLVAVIGPDFSVAGDVGKAHEFGGTFRREHYDRRPFMGPALEKTASKIPSFWASSVK